jgi:PAS domain S-box-containing protein
MEVKTEKTADEVKRLQSCINDLISVLALPAIWSGNESSQIVGTLLDVLLAMLRLDFAYARLSDPSEGPPIEVVRLTQREHPSAQPQEVGRALDRWLSGDQTTSRFVVPNPAGEGEVSIASFSLGLQDEVGVLVAGSRRADFPTDIERLLLRVAANQTGIGLQEARRSGDQKRVAEALERRVAERTRQLTAVNEGLRRSEAYLAEAQRLSQTGSFGWRLSTGEILWSEETFRIFQYDRTTKPSVELVLQRFHPEDAAFVKQTIERASQDGKDFDFEHRLLMPGGSVKYVHVVARAVSDESGGIEFVGSVMDVTEQHQARADLEKAFDEIKKSEGRLRMVIDTIPGMVWSGLPDGTFDFVSQPWLRYLGCSWEELSAQGGLRSVVHPDDLEGSDARWIATRATGRHTDHELRMRRADGQYRWFLTRALPLRDELGNIVKWYGTATDIEDRKRAEAGLREQASLLNLTHDTIFVRDMDDVITYWNHGAEQLYGWTADTAVGQVSHQLTQTVLPAPIDQINAELLATGRWEGELTHTKRDGTQVVVASRWSLQRDERGLPTAILETNNDITDRKQAEEAQLRLGAIVSSSDDAIISKTLEGIITSWNAGAQRIFGYGAEEAVGRPITILIPSDRQDEESQIIETLRRGESVHHFETVRLRKDGRQIDVSLTISPIKDAKGQIIGVSKIARDITERKRAAEALRQAEADLAHVSRVTTMGELTASLGHEVNQPITAAVTNANTCVRWLAGDSPNIQEARDAAIRSAKDGTRAAEIINRIRLLFKKGTTERELVEVNEVIQEMIVLLRGEATRYAVSIRADLPADLPQLMADRVQLQQVMLNLIMNSIDAMKDVDGTRELAIKSQRAENELLQVSVSDTGVGLPAQQAGEIFNAFFTTKLQGTGLGLSISRSIVESHGGRLWAADNSSRGASFYFTLSTKVEPPE